MKNSKEDIWGDSNHDGQAHIHESGRLGPLIKTARRALDMSQEELATRSGVSLSTLEEIEKDASNAKMATLRKIIEVGLQGRIEFSIYLK